MSYLDGRASGRKRKRKSLSGEMGGKQLKKENVDKQERLAKDYCVWKFAVRQEGGY